MSPIFIYIIIFALLMSFVGVVWSAVSSTTKQVKSTSAHLMSIQDRNELREELKELTKLVKIKQKELETLTYATEQAKRKTVNDLTVEQEEALNKYEYYGIRLPIDIVEELAYSNCVTYHSAINFIENQRKVWKGQFTTKLTKGMY
ncbi:GP16.7-like replication protein [Bacillus phage DLc1]|uniref:DNA replication organizer n=1 Tax=Bacillus phage DLc1 TaxID=2777318 RepID=A0A7M1RRH3_9CAUD|nr:GP16.7-like replication protein [Bacillus phage DLc1]QOR56299.1 hypothetical protein [Bacillus phage DLc1]